MDDLINAWLDRATSRVDDWPVERVIEAKRRSGERVSVVLPARNEAGTVGGIARRIIDDLVIARPLVDEVVVMDSDSTDETAARAAAAGATVHATSAVRPESGSHPGKGEALWKSLFVTSGDLIVFIDADLTVWSTSFVTGLLGPLLERPGTALVKGFYERMMSAEEGGGRVTELVARPLLNLWWPELSGVVQPLAGEWAIRRSLMETLPIPVGYGVELAVLLDTLEKDGLDAIAQVDLGRRDHRHQPLPDLGIMAAEILSVAYRRGGSEPQWPSALSSPGRTLRQYDPRAGWRVRGIPDRERPPAKDLLADSVWA